MNLTDANKVFTGRDFKGSFHAFRIDWPYFNRCIVEQVRRVFVIAAFQSVSMELNGFTKFKDDVIASLGHQAPKERVASVSSLDRKLLVRFDGRCHFGRWIFVRREQRQFPEIFILKFNFECENDIQVSTSYNKTNNTFSF